MKWTPEADDAVKKVPFFVRKRVRARVENEAQAAGKHVVTLADVKATQKRYLSNMASEVKGFQLDTCFGTGGCPNRSIASDPLLERLEALLNDADLLDFLKSHVPGKLKFHHEFRVTLADCPNACSQPQIKDIGILGACLPALTDAECSLCEECVEVCQEDAVALPQDADRPCIDALRCLSCGKCIPVCPTGTLVEGQKGYRVQLGGKLGRHPQLARELPGIYSEDEVVSIVADCIAFFKQHSRGGKRFAEIFGEDDFENLKAKYARP